MPATQQKKPARIRQDTHWATIMIGLATVVVCMALSVRYSRAMGRLDMLTADLRVKAMPLHPSTNSVMLIAIDNQSINAIGQWPWPRAKMAQLVQALTDYKVKVIAFDVLFTEYDGHDTDRATYADRLRAAGENQQEISSVLGLGNDDQLAEAIKRHGNVVVPYFFANHRLASTTNLDSEVGFQTKLLDPAPKHYTVMKPKGFGAADYSGAPAIFAKSYLPPIEPIRRAARSNAFVDIDADDDGVIRREMTLVDFPTRTASGSVQHTFCMPLYLATLDAFYDNVGAMADLRPLGEGQPPDVRIGDLHIPVDEIGRSVVVFRGPKGTFPHVSAADVINGKVQPPDLLAGKIAMVGATASAIGDRATTPAGPEFPRVEIHANAIQDALAGDFLRYSKAQTYQTEFFATILLGVGITIAAATLAPLYAFLALVILSFGYFGYAQHLMVVDRLMVGIVQPQFTVFVTFTTIVAYRYFTEGRDKRFIRQAFEHYLHPDIVESLVADPKNLKLGGERRHLSILFADIVGFTSRAERSDPVELVGLLNAYMTRMTDLIFDNAGVVDKLMGDGIMAFWGAPVAIDNPARHAVDCGLKMMAGLASLKRDDPRFADFNIGIGVATGEAIAGNFGGLHRFDYSLIGDVVNFASRLEGLTRKFRVGFLVDQNTIDEAKGSYITRQIGLVKVKGKVNAVPVVEVAGSANDGVDPKFYEQFQGVVDLLRAGKAEVAKTRLGEMLNDHPDDEVVGLYLEKLGEAHGVPPKEMVFEFESK